MGFEEGFLGERQAPAFAAIAVRNTATASAWAMLPPKKPFTKPVRSPSVHEGTLLFLSAPRQARRQEHLSEPLLVLKSLRTWDLIEDIDQGLKWIFPVELCCEGNRVQHT